MGTGSQPALTNGAFSENMVNVLLNFEIKEVVNLSQVLIFSYSHRVDLDLDWTENPVSFSL